MHFQVTALSLWKKSQDICRYLLFDTHPLLARSVRTFFKRKAAVGGKLLRTERNNVTLADRQVKFSPRVDPAKVSKGGEVGSGRLEFGCKIPVVIRDATRHTAARMYRLPHQLCGARFGFRLVTCRRVLSKRNGDGLVLLSFCRCRNRHCPCSCRRRRRRRRRLCSISDIFYHRTIFVKLYSVVCPLRCKNFCRGRTMDKKLD